MGNTNDNHSTKDNESSSSEIKNDSDENQDINLETH